MSFVVTLALLIGLLAAGPLLAHLLQRGSARNVEFPPTHWVVPQEHIATEPKRIEDRGLMLLRISIIVALALLGATPLVRCDRKRLDRTSGASVARILVLDDSGSMSARFEGDQSRFDASIATALSLVEQMREGDSVGIVLASKPARLLLAPTNSSSTLQKELSALKATDRSTDISGALALSRSVLAHQPQLDRKLLLLSDLAEAGLSPSPDVVLVQSEIARPLTDCAALGGRIVREQLEVDFACSNLEKKRRRSVELVESPTAKTALARAEFLASPQGQVVFGAETPREALNKARYVRLADSDDNPQNDLAPVISKNYRLSIGLYADPVASRVVTGGSTVIEQALRAIDPSWLIQPLSTVPDDPRKLGELSVLLLDDPPPLSAETRSAIAEFVRRGSTAIALMGPSASAAQLASLHLPFLEQRAEWETKAPSGLLPFTLESDPIGSTGLDEVSAKGRFVFDESHDPHAKVQARWKDQVPFWLERPLGRGTLIVLGLPSSVALSDWALRPGFLAVLDSLVTTSKRRGSARIVTAGSPWHFARDENALVKGPNGPLAMTTAPTSVAEAQLQCTPDRVGYYEVRRDNAVEERIALWPPEETLTEPRPWPVAATDKPNQATGRMDTSRYLVFALLGLLVLEMGLRLRGATFRLFATIFGLLLRRKAQPTRR